MSWATIRAKPGHGACRSLLLGGLLAAATLAAQPDAELSLQEELGKRVFLHGENPSGREITAVLGDGGAEVAAALLPCASCHGEDGHGRSEGGLSPSDVTWASLTRPYTERTESGREHPPYTEALVKRAFTMGVDPAGNPLHVAMPRYRLTHEEANALVAYLKRLGRERRPGVGEAELRLGVVLPPADLLDGLGGAIRGIVEARVVELNRQGGLYSRRLAFSFVEAPAPAAARRQAVADFLAENDVFALCASYLAGADAELAALARREEIPVIGPFSGDPQVDFPLNRHVFYLLSGYETQARALVDHAAARLPAPRRVVVVRPRFSSLDAAVAGVVDQGRRFAERWPAVVELAYPPGGLANLQPALAAERDDSDVVVFLGPENDARALFATVASLGWRPYLLMVQALSGNAALAAEASLAARTFVAFPTLAADLSPQRVEEYRRLVAAHGLDTRHPAAQLTALAAVELLVEGLERAGRQLSRERFIASLEELFAHQTGLTPPLTYGPNRRVGAAGAYVVQPDLEHKRFPLHGTWVTPR